MYVSEDDKQTANSVHAFHRQLTADSNKMVLDLSINAMKTPGLAAAGGIAATLGFYSANYARLGDLVAVLNSILFWLFLALLFTVITSGLAYLTQWAFTISAVKLEQIDEHPFINETSHSKRFSLIGRVLQLICIILVFFSYMALFYAGYQFLKLV